jgi:hypothetical protein
MRDIEVVACHRAYCSGTSGWSCRCGNTAFWVHTRFRALACVMYRALTWTAILKYAGGDAQQTSYGPTEVYRWERITWTEMVELQARRSLRRPGRERWGGDAFLQLMRSEGASREGQDECGKI